MTSFPMEQTEITALHMNPVYTLTNRAKFLRLKFPELRRLAGAFACVPALARIAAFSVSATCASLSWCRYISAEQRPVSVRTGGPLSAGERCSVFFCTL